MIERYVKLRATKIAKSDGKEILRPFMHYFFVNEKDRYSYRLLRPKRRRCKVIHVETE